MDIKKILALTIIALALFSCMSAASAGLFDFFGGGEVKNQTHTFDGFTLDIPETANVSQSNASSTEGAERHTFTIRMQNESDSSQTYTITVSTSQGSRIVSSVDEYVSNWVSDGASKEGTHGEWTIININGVQKALTSKLTVTYSGYILAKHTGNKLIIIKGTDLNQLEKIADTYKEV